MKLVHRCMLSTLTILFLSYLGFSVLVGCSQRSLMYFPSKIGEQDALATAPHYGMAPWRDTQGTLIGWTPAQEKPMENPVAVLIFHGNAGHALQRSYFFEALSTLPQPLALRVMEYPGYGPRPGSASFRTLVQAGIEAVDLLSQDYEKVILLGESLGSGVAAEVIRQRPEVEGALLITPYHSMTSLAQSRMPWLPVRLILTERYEPLTALTDFQGRVGLIVAGEDQVIPPRFGMALYEKLSGVEKQMWLVEGHGHNDLPYQWGPEWLQEAISFVTGRRE